MTIVIAILIFCVIILLHEFGHFIAAKACGIYVKEFSLGMGPRLLKKKGKETEYSVRLLPIGGFCAFEGEDGGASDEEKAQNPRAFNARPVWQRMIVILAGPIMNLILGLIVSIFMVCSMEYLPTNMIHSFEEQSISSKYLQPRDEILAIDGLPIFTDTDISYKLLNSDRKNADGNLVYDFKVRRDGEVITLRDVEFMTEERDDGTNGLYFDFIIAAKEKSFTGVISQSWRESCSTARIIVMTLIDLIRGKYGINDMSGPVGVGTVISDAVSDAVKTFSPTQLLYIIALITINVGVFNLLPIPALDGARFVFLVIELIRRKPVKPEVEGAIHSVGMILMMILMVVVTFGDIRKLFTGGFH